MLAHRGEYEAMNMVYRKQTYKKINTSFIAHLTIKSALCIYLPSFMLQ